MTGWEWEGLFTANKYETTIMSLSAVESNPVTETESPATRQNKKQTFTL